MFDTAAQAVVDVDPGERSSLYVCGITPYDATHLGHANTYVAFDLLQRLWRDAGSQVNYVQNVTDVDDPLLERADATGVDWRDLAREQTELFAADMQALRVLPPEHFVGATEAIDWVVEGVVDLLHRDLAYRVPGTDGEPDGDVYFDSRAAADAVWQLGSESHYDESLMLTLSAERGGDPERLGKRDALDPLLWRVKRDGEPFWDGAELGEGRPGWHIECAVIALKCAGGTLTVQGGGSDLIFPHHEFSAGHASALTGEPLAEHFVHTGMVGLDGEKMSKSLGNLVLVSKLRAQGVDPRVIRLVLLGRHYRSDWFYEDALLDQASSRLNAWQSRLATTDSAQAEQVLADVRAALANDLDAPTALAVLDAWAAAPAAADASGAALVRDTVDALLGVNLLGVNLD
ncbi:cysteine--1-D-myo-inosityl 2-amino-2-deoxy-alpha-D-glucopyranoside ligase [Galactobacter sp.]|uniref:cysteine--1-D-myo-inosityl 2-amino-2-deoxy-alpha-D-glucopyranoside ligase n=1 Tax=Galactobacter sp. TaxID=2676125 RepID=UPI0025BB3A4E|nr:cysteine--1-D-myo-inosityl 2-amino-2-deoxy-alpha-D-glucopyranoside ligase [Galactobacter sp.]